MSCLLRSLKFFNKFKSLELLDLSFNNFSLLTQSVVEFIFRAPKQMREIVLYLNNLDKSVFFPTLKQQIINTNFHCEFFGVQGNLSFQFPEQRKTVKITTQLKDEHLNAIFKPESEVNYKDLSLDESFKLQFFADDLKEEKLDNLMDVLVHLINTEHLSITISNDSDEICFPQNKEEISDERLTQEFKGKLSKFFSE